MGSGKNFVDAHYEAEEAESWMQFEESKQHAASVRLPTDTVALLDALAERFRTSRNSIISDFVRSEAMAAFQSLSEQDLFSVALAADKNYATFEKVSFDGGGTFSMIAKHVQGKALALKESSEVAA